MLYPKDISVVVPLYNEEESLPELVDWINRVMVQNSFKYEVILVDDGSKDRSWEVIQTICSENKNVKGIRFTRNYGKSAGLSVGFKHAVGEVVLTMDADLQDSPDEITDLYKMIVKDGFDLVSGWKKKRYDPLSKTIPTKLYNAATRYFSGIKLNDFNCGLKAYKNRVIKCVEVYGEMHRYIPVIAKYNGFGKIGEKVVEHRARKYGVTKFGLERFIFGPLDLLSITFVTKFKKRPMHFFGAWGLISFFTGFLTSLWLIIDKFYSSNFLNIKVRGVTDQPLFYVSLVAVIIGTQLFLAGYIAELMNADSTKKSDYLIDEVLNN